MEHTYKIESCKSSVDFDINDNNLQEHIARFKNARAVAWYYDEIVFYNILNGAWNVSLKDQSELVRLRLFNKNKELHVWRNNGILRGRLRDDAGGESIEYITGNPLLNGTNFSQGNPGVIATEEKGINYDLPYPELKSLTGTKNRVAIVTRNYIGNDDIGQAGYVDCRFVDFGIIETQEKQQS